MVDLITRAEWGARHPDGDGPAPLPARQWWLHHSATIAPDLAWLDADRDGVDDDERRAVRAIEDIGQKRFGQGMSYTWLIPPSGRVYQGHSMGRLGAHTAGRNSVGRAICFVGNYELHEPTAAQLDAAAAVLVAEHRAGRAATHRLTGGHRDLKATACPGRAAYALIPEINRRAAALWIAGPDQEDPMANLSPEQDRMLREIHAALGYTHAPDAVFPHPGSLSNAIVSTWAQTFHPTDYGPALVGLHQQLVVLSERIDAVTRRIDAAIGQTP